MAAGNVTLYTPAILSMGVGGFNMSTDNFNVVLCTTTYNPQANIDALYSAVSPTEVAAGGGYSVGGVALTGVSWTQNTATCTFSAQSAVWAGATFSARYAIIVRRASITLASTDRLLCYVDLTASGNASVTASTFQVNWNNSSTPSSANTVFTLTHNP